MGASSAFAPDSYQIEHISGSVVGRRGRQQTEEEEENGAVRMGQMRRR